MMLPGERALTGVVKTDMQDKLMAKLDEPHSWVYLDNTNSNARNVWSRHVLAGKF